ncbi:MAG: STAS domain-containing protein [Oscillochloridaceae bacterium]|nr:STAS domain-containing protein [Chloroflexaceae bacterium]MDW8391555.1 STAS domain-containing protein [Oscillochloridaceae bacterium]
MFRVTQRQINYGIFGVLTVLGGIAVVIMPFINIPVISIVLTVIGTGICGTLWWAYARGWEASRYALIVLLTLLVGFGERAENLQSGFFHIIYTIPVIALVLTNPLWVLGSALTLLAMFAVRAGGGAYIEPIPLITFTIIIGSMVLSRLAIDNAQHLEIARREAESERARAEAERARAEQQAEELARRNAEQERLLELIATLETPTITLADGILLAPIVGALDSQRARQLTSRLLHETSAQRAHHVIIDIRGAVAVDTQVVEALLQTARALELLGCQVTLTGISPGVALTLTQLGMPLDTLHTQRSPQEALARVYGSSSL